MSLTHRSSHHEDFPALLEFLRAAARAAVQEVNRRLLTLGARRVTIRTRATTQPPWRSTRTRPQGAG